MPVNVNAAINQSIHQLTNQSINEESSEMEANQPIHPTGPFPTKGARNWPLYLEAIHTPNSTVTPRSQCVSCIYGQIGYARDVRFLFCMRARGQKWEKHV